MAGVIPVGTAADPTPRAAVSLNTGVHSKYRYPRRSVELEDHSIADGSSVALTARIVAALKSG
jgi:hypothetical protein